MAEKSKKSAAKGSEVLQFKSPAEFFAENQNIAGFDNPGKALYTTIRELVENSLDAAESAGRLPDIDITIEEMDTPAFNALRGIDTRKRVDKSLYHAAIEADEEEDDGSHANRDAAAAASSAAPAQAAAGAAKKLKKAGAGAGAGTKGDDQLYYRLTCRDNGCGMPHEKIPDMLGRVLAGSKYGVRQTRGKFGLGAKMALIWSKKSTGMPIEVTSSHMKNAAVGPAAGSISSSSSASSSASSAASSASSSAASSASAGGPSVPPSVSYCKLDIDIYKNEPHVLAHTLRDNRGEKWIGTQMSVCISGAWSVYRARVMHYFQQLAVITPYAQFNLKFSGSGSGKADFSYEWKRRSTQMPRPPIEIKHHPSSVNDLLVRSLIDGSKGRASTSTLLGFLSSQFSSIDKGLAGRLIAELGPDFSPGMEVGPLSTKQVHQVTRLLAVAKIPPPSGACLSPAGEYNLRLGIMKELRPDLVATHSSPVSVFEGNPFIVEAGVALGGRGADGLTVHRFANRIPLLFEGGADVCTRTATTRIPWATYKIDPVRDKIGVFVSIVSTKIPFKGTGKEYIGDDIEAIRDAVRSAIQSCCSQLRLKLLRASAIRARANRRKILAKYVPDVARAVFAALKSFSARPPPAGAQSASSSSSLLLGDDEDEEAPAAAAAAAGTKRQRSGDLDELDEDDPAGHSSSSSGSSRARRRQLLAGVASGTLTEASIGSKLMEAVEKADLDAALEQASAITGLAAGGDDEEGGGASVFVAPTRLATFQGAVNIALPHCVVRFLPGALLPPTDPSALALTA